MSTFTRPGRGRCARQRRQYASAPRNHVWRRKSEGLALDFCVCVLVHERGCVLDIHVCVCACVCVCVCSVGTRIAKWCFLPIEVDGARDGVMMMCRYTGIGL